MGVLVEVSVNVTVHGTVPDIGVPVKLATGATAAAAKPDAAERGDRIY